MEDADVEEATDEVVLPDPLGRVGVSGDAKLLDKEFGLDAAVADPSASPCSPVPSGPSPSSPKILSRALRYSSSLSLRVFEVFDCPDRLDAEVFDPAGVDAPEEAGLLPCPVGDGRRRIRSAAEEGNAGTF
jgi:hypothetical protein